MLFLGVERGWWGENRVGGYYQMAAKKPVVVSIEEEINIRPKMISVSSFVLGPEEGVNSEKPDFHQLKETCSHML